MGTRIHRRPLRRPGPQVPGGELTLEPPPEPARSLPSSPWLRLLPLVSVLASVGFVAVLGADNPSSWLFGGMIALSTLGMVAGGGARGGGARRAEVEADRTDYLRYLAHVRRRVRATATEQRRALAWAHPDPPALVGLARGPRMWERRPADEDFAHVRVGRGAQRLATALVAPPTGPVEDLEPVSARALRRLVRTHSVVAGLPTAVSLRAFAVVALRGAVDDRRALARAMLAALVTLHGPDDLIVAVVCRGPARAEWEWTKWLPHVCHPRRRDGAGPLRMVGPSLAAVERWLAPELAGRSRFSRTAPPPTDRAHLVVVVDEGTVEGTEHVVLEEGLLGVTLLDLDAAPALAGLTARHGLALEIAAEPASGRHLGAAGPGGVEWFGRPDGLGPGAAEALARRLSPCRLPTSAAGRADDGVPGLLGLLGVEGEPDTFDVAAAWRPRSARERLRVPIGVDEAGQPVELDLKESAQEGMGPHGLCVGATGSGKSELLRTIVLGLVATHSSAELNLVLVDFKGGATFAGLAALPHTAAVITNLADDLSLVDRMQDALAGELNRRQELLRAAGNLTDVADYERARAHGAALEPLPTLFVVVDEFSELLAQKPDFAELFVAIGRLGRSLRIHLLLASQRLEEGRLRGLDSHLSYRIGLRTFSAADSRAALGVADAHDLPPVPGAGYLRTDPTVLSRFTASYVSGPLHTGPERGHGEEPTVPGDRRPRPFRAEWVDPPGGPGSPTESAPAPPEQGDPPGTGRPASPRVLDVVVARLRGQGPPAHEVWLPPLTDPPALDALLPPLEIDPDRGLHARGLLRVDPDGTAVGGLALPLGIVDRPYHQRRDVLWADLSGAAGHAAVVGGPRSGRSTLLRTLVTAGALTHTPDELRFYVLDAGGGGLGTLAGLPHVGSVAGRGDTDLVRRTVAEMQALLVDRERRFRAAGVDSAAALRRSGADPGPTGPGWDALADVVLVIDGWSAFRGEHEQLEATVIALASSGLSYGLHVVVAATRWAEIRPSLKDLLGTRVELRLGDPAESEVDRRTAALVPSGRPGRGLSPEGLHVLTALPRLDGGGAEPPVSAAALVAGIADAWSGPGAPPVRLLPARVGLDALPAPDPAAPHRLPIGLDESRLEAAVLDVAAEPHLVCFADVESGKTALLRLLARQITARYAPEAARLIVVDYRRGLLGSVETEHLLAYATSTTSCASTMTELATSLGRRLPGPEVTPEALRSRSWWTGPEVFVLVDDYDLVSSAAANPLAPLVELLAQARDIGLHLVVARRSGGAARAQFDPVLARLRELATPGLVMNGDREEGPLVGAVRPARQPPGRGRLVSRRTGDRLVQLAWVPPEEPPAGGSAPGPAAAAEQDP